MAPISFDTNRIESMPPLRFVDDDGEPSIDRIQIVNQATPQLVKPVPVSVQKLVRPVAVKPRPVKPIAMKVARPIPQRISEQFYNEAFDNGLTMRETNEAAALAHDWHRRWTQQDEQNHTMPHQDFYDQQNIPDCYDFNLDRQGAQNPSLGGASFSSKSASIVDDRDKRALGDVFVSERPDDYVEEVIFHPEDRLSASSWSDSQSSSLSSYNLPQVKRRMIGPSRTEEPQPQPIVVRPAPVAIRPMAVRPVAIVPQRPEVPRQFIQNGGVPQDIMTMRRNDCVSPISMSGETVLSSDNFMMTLVNQTNEAVHVVEDDCDSRIESLSKPSKTLPLNVQSARDAVLHSLAISQGDVDSDKFKASLEPLMNYYSEQVANNVHISDSSSIDGMWLQLSKANYFGRLGENDNGDPMYTLGRMSFDMFSPTNLVCSLQGSFNPVEIVDEEGRKKMLETVPKSLREEVESGKTELRTYHVVAAFTIEADLAAFPNAPNKDVHRPIKGIMTTYGYSLSDPEVPNRHSIWFTGGRIEPNNSPQDITAWKRLFTMYPPKYSFGEKAKHLAVKLLMGATIPEGMNDDGSMDYTFTRPIGGHGTAYVDVVYLDETLRIVKGHRGTIFVFSRLPQK